ncbi:MAG: sulfatase-like hydrolase/transferase, partial [Bacteroidota bacterium]
IPMKKITTILCLFLSLVSQAQTKKNKTENVVLITLDGMRWQEVFNGADSSLFKKEKSFKDPAGLATSFWKDDTEQRRKALMPFLWETIATQGQIYGNRAYSNHVNVSNDQWFSYPGYNEILTGFADARVNSNDKKYNQNTTVLEFINNQPAFKGKVAAFCSWEVFPYIINDKRSGILVNAGLQKAAGTNISAREQMLNELMPRVPNPLGEVRLDAFTFHYALEYIKKSQPRVLFLSFDETDDFAHAGEYGAYLHGAKNVDSFIRQLWEYLQSNEKYKGKTTLLITVDHGRGSAADDKWKDHGQKTEGSDQIWFAAMGPDTPAIGEVKTPGQLYQNQVAKTIAALLGLNYSNEKPVGEAIKAVFHSPAK